MGRLANHRKRWLSNRRFLPTIGKEYGDWAVTACFYTALHAMEAAFAKHELPKCSSHTDREKLLQNTLYDSVRTAYMVLYNASRVARYECRKECAVTVQHIQATLLAKYLWQIEQFVRDEIGSETATKVITQPVVWPTESPGE